MADASVMTIDFRAVPEMVQHSSGKMAIPEKPLTADGKLLTPKQIRARARRRRKRGQHLDEQEMAVLYKPIEEWDLEELARGRPRNSKGTFQGAVPQWVDRSIFEKAMERYTAVVKTEMRATTNDALKMMSQLINNEDVDEKGKPIVSPSTKLDAAKFLIEHVVGKPTQRIESEVSVKLQSILSQVIANPSDEGYEFGHFPGVTMALSSAEDVEDDRGE